MVTKKNKMMLAGIVAAAALMLPFGMESAQAAQMNDGVMGQSIEDETVYDTLTADLDGLLPGMVNSRSLSLLGAAASYDEYIEDAWTTEGQYTSATYYHRSEYEDYQLINGIDVSWWQAGGKGSTTTNIDWEQAHEDGIDFTIVRVASRDTEDGSIYEDTSADAHIQAALENDINVGLYIFSQALTVAEAEEEAEYVLELLDEYGWDVTMPIVMDREAGSYKRLTAGALSKSKETKICNAFATVIAEAGYQPMVYASASWIVNYMDTDSLEENGCKIWLARYNNSTDKPTGNLTYELLSAINYEIWQYSSTGSVSGYSGNLDVDFWYKDTSAKTKNLQMTANTADSITLKWSQADDATKYRVYRYDSSTGKYTAVASTSKKSYTDTDLESGTTYQYKVRCYWTIGGTNYYGTYSDVLEVTTLPAKVSDLTAESLTSTSISLSWISVTGADGYRIYQYSDTDGAFVKLADVTSGSTSSYTVTGLTSAKSYQFKVRAYKKLSGTTYWGSASAALATATKPAKVGELAVAPASATSITLTWNKVSRATGYQIYRLNETTGKYEKIATIKNNKTFTYTDTGLSGAKEYTYKVRAYRTDNGTNYYGTCSSVQSMVTKPAKVKNLSLSTKSSSVTLTWNKVTRATGYQIYRLNTSTGKYEKIATIKNNKTFTYKDTGLKKGTTYTYKVRAYKSYSGSTYVGTCSSVTTIKAK